MNNDSNNEPSLLHFHSEAQLSETISNISTATVPTESINRLKAALSKHIVVRKMPLHSKWGPRFLITTAAMLIFLVSLIYWLNRNPQTPPLSSLPDLPHSPLPKVTTVLLTNTNAAALQNDLLDVENRIEKTSQTIRLLHVRDQIDSLLETTHDWSTR